MKKYLPFILGVIGTLIFCFITLKTGITPTLHSLHEVGFKGFILLILGQFLLNLLLSLSWKVTVPNISFLRLILARFIRDAAASCLPFSQLGGMVIGIRATIIGKEENNTATSHKNSSSQNDKIFNIPFGIAANIVDITTEIIGQIAFITLSILYLTQTHYAGPYIWPLAIGIAILSIAIAAFIWTQQKSGLILQKISFLFSQYLSSQIKEHFKAQTEHFQNSFTIIWSKPLNIALGAFLHLISWSSGAVLTCFSLHLLHNDLSFLNIFALEGLVCGILSAGFFIPGGIGVQEGAYIAIGLIFGIPKEISLCLSLLRRGRDIVIGVPTLLLWQFCEFYFVKKKAQNAQENIISE